MGGTRKWQPCQADQPHRPRRLSIDHEKHEAHERLILTSPVEPSSRTTTLCGARNQHPCQADKPHHRPPIFSCHSCFSWFKSAQPHRSCSASKAAYLNGSAGTYDQVVNTCRTLSLGRVGLSGPERAHKGRPYRATRSLYHKKTSWIAPLPARLPGSRGWHARHKPLRPPKTNMTLLDC